MFQMSWLTFFIHFFLFLSLSSAHGVFDHDDGLEHKYFVNECASRMMEAFNANDTTEVKIVDCYTYGDKLVVEDILKEVPKHHVIVVDEDTLNKLIDFCTYAKWNGLLPFGNETTPMEKLGVFSGIFMYPGTKWCGAGNVSSGFNDLGPEESTDRCCRAHDHCHDSIPGRSTKHGLENASPIARSHCTCDSVFLNCLRKADTKTSHRVGRIFFNFLCMKCFKRDFPISECVEYKRSWPFRRCQEYKLDNSKDPVWQFFDNKHYETADDDEEAAKDEEFLIENFSDWEKFVKEFHLHDLEHLE